MSQGVKNAATTSEQEVPGRTLGFMVMVIIILFVGFWMNRQSSLLDQAPTMASGSAESLPGFNSDAWFLPDDPMLGFVEIAAGEFTMGSNPALDRMAYENERWSNLRRQGSVSLPTFYISRYETTVAQFREFALATGLDTSNIPLQGAGNLPISNITWPEMLAYAQWLEEQLRQSSQTPTVIRQLLDGGAHVTLPSEAEWEKAARGNDGRVFPWGSQPSIEFANFNGNAPSPVGSLACPQCSYNLSDMAGNVWEVTRSPLQPYPYDPADDASDLDADAIWVMRGGSFSDVINNVRTAVRGGADPGVRNPTIGFRVVISPQ